MKQIKVLTIASIVQIAALLVIPLITVVLEHDIDIWNDPLIFLILGIDYFFISIPVMLAIIFIGLALQFGSKPDSRRSITLLIAANGVCVFSFVVLLYLFLVVR